MFQRFSLALVAAIFALGSIADAQTTNPLQYVTSHPGGACRFTSVPQFDYQDGTYWNCTGTFSGNPSNWLNGTWTQVTPPTSVVAGDGNGGFKTATAAQIGAIGLTGITTNMTPAAAGGQTIGTGALPFGSLYLGTAATNNQRILPTATAASRTFNITDQGTNGAVAFGDQADPTKVLLFDTHAATTATTTTFAFAPTVNRTVTFPDAAITVARTDAGQTFTGTQVFGAITATGVTGLTAATTPNAAGGTTLGSNALPFSGAYIGGSATNNIQVTGTATGARTATLPDASITVSGARTYWEGTTSSAAGTPEPGLIVHTGTVALGSASPSVVTVTGFSPAFTSTSTFACTASPTGGTAAIAAAGVAVTLASASSVTFTGPNTVSTVINYICMGY